MKEDGEGRAAPKVAGAPRVCRGAVRGEAERRKGRFPLFRSSRALFLAASPSRGIARRGREAGEGAPTSPGRTLSPTHGLLRSASSRVLKKRSGQEGKEWASSDRVWRPPGLGCRAPRTRREGKVPAARSPGSRRRRRPPGGAAVRGLRPPQLRAPLGLRSRPPLS